MATHPARASRVAAALLSVVALAGCGTRAPSSTSGPGQASTTSTTPPPASSNPLRAAQDAFETWADRNQDYDTWWAHLKPLLSPGGQLAYAGTDPSAIPQLKVTGAFRLDPKPPGEPGLTALVHVSTDRGPFGLFMTRQTPQSPWLLLQINFPAGIH